MKADKLRLGELIPPWWRIEQRRLELKEPTPYDPAQKVGVKLILVPPCVTMRSAGATAPASLPRRWGRICCARSSPKQYCIELVAVKLAVNT